MELVRPMFPYPASRAHEASKGAVHRSVKAQNIGEDILKSKRKRIPRWTKTLRMLESRTPKRTTGWTRHALKIVIPAEAAKAFTTNLDDNIWDIHDRTTCEIELYKGMEGDGRSALLLSGDNVAVQDATDIIMGACEDGLICRPDPSNPETPLLRGDPEIAKELCIASKITHQPRRLITMRKTPYIWNNRFEDIPKPETWDQYSFMNYIRTLCQAKLRPHRAIEFYGTPQAADEVIMVLIQQAFRDKTAADSLTVAAFRMALECIEERGLSFRPHARRLFTQLQIRRLPFDTEVFNKFLRGSLRTRDLDNFNQMLTFMAGYGCVPNYQTWKLFLHMMPDEGAKREVVMSMEKLGLLHNPSAVSDVVREFVAFDMYRAIQSEKDAKTFCAEMDESYGPTWPSVTALNRMLNVCSFYGKFDMCYELLDHFENVYEKRPEYRTLQTILVGAGKTNDIGAALKVLRLMEERPYLTATFHLYRELYTLAWRWRLFNVMAVIWTYACLKDMTCFAMRHRVSQQLANPGYKMAANFLTPKPSELYRFFAMPGYVPVAVGPGLGRELLEDPAQVRHQGAVLARMIRDQYRGYETTAPLSEMIEKAWELDKTLHMQRNMAANIPGSHVVSIRDVLAGDESFEIPLQPIRQGRKEKVVHVPVTSEALVHNHEDEWYSNLEAHPTVAFKPWKCIMGEVETKEAPSELANEVKWGEFEEGQDELKDEVAQWEGYEVEEEEEDVEEELDEVDEWRGGRVTESGREARPMKHEA